MERNTEHIYCKPAYSHSSSSSIKIFCDGEKQCSPCGYYRCCKSSLFNDHTYSILKRICHKIIKNYSRQRCRENYSIFDGGNSTSIRSLIKGQKDGVDSYCNCMHAKSVCRKNGDREIKNEDVSMQDIRRNLKGKRSDYDDMDKWQDSTRHIVQGENNIGGENKKFRKGKAREGKDKMNEMILSKTHKDSLEDEPKKLIKVKNSSGLHNEENNKNRGGNDANIEEKFQKGNRRHGKDKKNEVIVPKNHNDTLKDGTKKLVKGKNSSGLYKEEKNANRGGNDANKEETKQFRKSKGGTDFDEAGSKKLARVKGSDAVDDLHEGLSKQSRRGKNRGEKEDRDRQNKKSKGDQTQIEKKVDQGGINKYKNRLGKHLNDNDGSINKLAKSSKKSISGKDKGNNDEGYQTMSKKKGSQIFGKDQDDGKGIQNKNGRGEPDRIALGPVRKNSERAKIGSGKSSQHPRYANTHGLKRTRKRGHFESSKLVANRKLYSSGEMIRLPLELQSCRYIRPCDVLRVKLEERDLSRCIACCPYANQTSLYRTYISCRPDQCGLLCG